MPPLPRLLALVLFVVLMALLGLLLVPALGAPRGETAATPALVLSQRAALVLGALALTLSLVIALLPQRRPEPSTPSADPAATVRSEVGTLAQLARSSVAQGAELSRERDVRRRAEEDARLRQQLLEQSLAERIRLGQDLHDGIIQSLYAAGLNVEAVRPLVRTQPDEVDRRLEQMREGLNRTIREVRGFVLGLAPDNLHRAGFARALSAQLAELQAGREARFDLRIEDAAAAALTPGQSVELLQIAREAVSNAFRHGRATELSLQVALAEREIRLEVSDNGVGFDPAAARGNGFGLGNMRARAGRMGGSLRIESRPGAGTRVSATLPNPPASAA